MILATLFLLAQTAVVEPDMTAESAVDATPDTPTVAAEAPATDAKAVVPRIDRITSERATYDRKEGVIVFDENVFVDDPEYKMHADQVYVFLDGTNELKRVVALGNVALTNELVTAEKKELRVGTCAKATYSKAISKLVMYGDESAPASLSTVGKESGELTGRKITFWLDSEQVEVEKSTITIDASSANGKTDMKKVLGK